MTTFDDDPVAGLIGRLRDADLAPGTLVGEFRVESKLGEGGMAQVFAAVHPVVGKRAAVKVISRRLCADQHAVERFVQEARTVHQIGHANIVDTFGFGTLPDGRCYFLMEWLSGESLADRLQKGALPLATTLEILTQIAEALEAAHRSGVIHRDLKPDNVFVDSSRERPSVKLLDFGIAKLAAADVTLPRTRSGMAMGTPGYMSPEQARGKPVDGKTDVYALGAMMFQMVLGRLPFEGDSAIDILAKHLAEPPPAPSSLWPSVPPRLEKLILAMLEKDPAARPDLSAVRRALAELRGQPLPERRAHRGRGVAWAVTAGATAVAGLGVLLFIYRSAPIEPTPAPARAPVVAPAPRATPAAATPAPAVATPVAPAESMLVVHADAPDAVLEIDGRKLGPDGKARFPGGGTHTVTASAPHRRPVTRVIELLAGQTVDVPLHLPAAASRKAEKPGSGDYTLDPFGP